jgi:hypothetical protein
MLRGAEEKAAKPVFEEIPPSVSGIRWVHTNGMSRALLAGDAASGLRIS